MYIQTNEIIKCSKCGCMNNYETVIREYSNQRDNFKRCLKCGHESHESTLTWTDLLNSTSKTIEYTYNPRENIITF